MWKNPEKLFGILLMEQREDENGHLDTKETTYMTNSYCIIFKSKNLTFKQI